MKQELGLVIQTDGNMAKVKVGRHSDCVACGACPSAQSIIIDAINKAGAKAGQRVRFEMQEQHVLTGAFVVFVLPLICAAVGALIGWQAGAGETTPIVVGAVVCFLASLIAVKMFDRNAARKQNLKPVIIEILS